MTYQPIQVRPTVTTIEREAEHDDTPPIIHIYATATVPQMGDRALCGWVKKVPSGRFIDHPPSCVVCAGLESAYDTDVWP